MRVYNVDVADLVTVPHHTSFAGKQAGGLHIGSPREDFDRSIFCRSCGVKHRCSKHECFTKHHWCAKPHDDGIGFVHSTWHECWLCGVHKSIKAWSDSLRGVSVGVGYKLNMFDGTDGSWFARFGCDSQATTRDCH